MVVESKKYTVAIDLGESNVVVVVGSKSADDLITIDSVVSQPCEGVKSGMIDNIALVEEAIKAAVSQSETALGVRILEAYAGISGEFVRFACHSDHVYVSDPQNGVGQGDVDALFDRMSRVQAPENEIIMERIPQNYIVDDLKEVKNPVGSFGRRLSSTFNFILCANTPQQRLENALRRLGIKLLKIVPNTLAVADSILSSDEKEEGVAIVNIGSGLTDLTIYLHNVVRYTVSIPIGGSAINNDIRSMMIPQRCIEKLKCKYGSAVADMVAENKVAKVSGRTPRETKNISLHNLAVAIEARVEMIVEFIKREIKESGYEGKLPYGVVLTGGCAKLANIDELFRRLTDMEIRIGCPVESLDEESLNMVASPEYATAVGVLIRGFAQGYCTTVSNPQSITMGTTQPKIEPAPAKQAPTPVETPQRGESSSRIIGVSEVYTPPPTRNYTPPKTVILPTEELPIDFDQMAAEVQAELTNKRIAGGQPMQETSLKTPLETPQEMSQEIQLEPIVDEQPFDTQADDAEQSQKEVVLPSKSKAGRDWSTMFKKAFERLNDGFDTADDEEI